MGKFSEKILSDVANFMCLIEDCLLLQNQINIKFRNIKKEKFIESSLTLILLYNSRLSELKNFLRKYSLFRDVYQGNETFTELSSIKHDDERDILKIKTVLRQNKVFMHKFFTKTTKDFSIIFNLVGEDLLASMLKRKLKRLQSLFEI